MHKQSEPSFRRFLETYGPTLKTHPSNLDPLSDQLLGSVPRQMRISSPGLDHIATLELQIAVSWSPELITNLCSLLRLVERQGVWPDNLTKGAVAFIPKDPEQVAPQPDEFRPGP